MASKEELKARLVNGHVITEQDIADMIDVFGEKGEPGVKGDPGEPGKDGKDGTNGTNGSDGKDGLSMLTEAEQGSLQRALDEASYGKGELYMYLDSLQETQNYLQQLVYRLVNIHPEELGDFSSQVPLSMSAEVLESESEQPISEEGKEEKEK